MLRISDFFERHLIWALFSVLLVAGGCVHKPAALLTGLERTNYCHLTTSQEISDFLGELSDRNDTAEKVTLGKSALGSPLDGLLISKEMNQFKDGRFSHHDKMTVMLIGSQHGMEPSGAEALLLLAKEIVEGSLAVYLEDMNFILIPNSNPDGKNSNRRVNGNKVNLSTDFTILSQPESRAIADALRIWEPELVLDIHESAVLKKKTLAKQGFLIDFEAQFEAANNPNVDKLIRTFSFGTLLLEIISRVNAQGLHAQRYIGEITNINQTVTHGGLSLRNLRNMAGMAGSFSFLLENRLDPSTGSYPTPRNIRERVAKQYLCISAFLDVCRNHRAEIMDICRHARISWFTRRGGNHHEWKDRQKEEPLYLSFAYVSDEKEPQITLPLRKLETGEPVKHSFRYNGVAAGTAPFTPPSSYIITAHHGLMRDFLDRHHIDYRIYKTEEQTAAVSFPVTIQKILRRKALTGSQGKNIFENSLQERSEKYFLHQGDIIVSLEQPVRKLIPLFLELQSAGSIFNFPEYSELIKENSDFFIFRVY